MKYNDFLQMLDEITEGESHRRVADKIGLAQSTFVAQLKKFAEGKRLVPMETLVAICRAYNSPILPAAVAAGHFTEEEAKRMASGVDVALSEISDEDLANETLRRLVSGKSGKSLSEPLDGEAQVVQLHPGRSMGGTVEQVEDLSADEQKVARKIGRPKLGDKPGD